MVEVDAEQWDETICDMMPCQHPLCWEALRRIESGNPRIALGPPPSPERESPDCEGELPTLKIVDLPLNCPRRQRITCSKSYGSVSKTVSHMKDTRSYFSNSATNDTWMPPVSVMSSERNHFPGLNSRVDSHTPHLSPISFDCWRQVEQIQVMDISELTAQGLDCQLPYGNLIVQWIPPKWPSRLQSKKPPARAAASSQRICVKDLALESTLSFKDSQVKRRKKSSKVPTGGQPYLLHLRRNKRVPTDSSSPSGKGEEATDGALRTSQFSFCCLPLAPLAPPHKEVDPETKSRKEALFESKKKATPPLIVLQKAPSVYRFEAKFPVKERCSRRIPGQLRVPPEGSGSLWHPMPDLGEKPACAEAPGSGKGGERGGGSGGDGLDKAAPLSQEASAEEGAAPLAPMAPPERKKMVRFVECKSNAARTATEGDPNILPRLLRVESKFRRYRRQLASWREPPPLLAPPPARASLQDPAPPPGPTDSPLGTPRESPRQPFSPNPPPPPPSPFFSLSSENSSLD